MKRTKQAVQALMIAIAWTSAKVVRIRINEAFMLNASTIEFSGKSYSVVAPAEVHVSAGQVLYFVASDGFPGWYYLLLYNGTAFTCTCPQKRACKHQRAAYAYETAKYEQSRVQVERFIDEDREAHLEDDVRMACMERQFENLVSAVA